MRAAAKLSERAAAERQLADLSAPADPRKVNIEGLKESIERAVKAGVAPDAVKAAEAKVVGVVVALDRQEKGGKDGEVFERSAIQEVEREHGIPVASVCTLQGLQGYIQRKRDPDLVQRVERHVLCIEDF